MDSNSKRQDGNRIGWIYRGAAIFVIILIITAIILGYFVSFIDSDGEPRDGLGRLLDIVPDGFSFILWQWAGFIWFFVDIIIIFSLIILTDRLFARSKLYFTGTKNVDF